MIVVDTSSLITLSIADLLQTVMEEYDIHTTETVLAELEATTEYDDSHAKAAQTALNHVDQMTVHQVSPQSFQSSRVDTGEASCAILTRDLDADFLITDDLRALPELQTITGSKVAITPMLLRALVQRGVLDQEEALEHLEQIAAHRDWLGAPIYRRAKQLFE